MIHLLLEMLEPSYPVIVSESTAAKIRTKHSDKLKILSSSQTPPLSSEDYKPYNSGTLLLYLNSIQFNTSRSASTLPVKKIQKMETAGQWLEKALIDVCQKTQGLDLDGDLISGLVSYCDLAPPLDAKEYLDNIVGEQAGGPVINEYLRRRGYTDTITASQDGPTNQLREYVKPPAKEPINMTRKAVKPPKETTATTSKNVPAQITQPQNQETGNQSKSKKKKSGKVISLAEASKGSIIFQKGKPCSCEARRHRLVSNCLSCGKIVCEQEGEGPCSFCGALVLREGSTYAGLEEEAGPVSDADAAAEAYAKRLVDYDRNSAARTTVIDDQSDYYEIEGNSWLSMEEKELLKKKKEEIEEAERANRNKVVISFDLVGRKVLLNEDEASEQLENSILLKPANEREVNRIKPNPTLEIQPIFIDPGHGKKNGNGKANHVKKGLSTRMCLEISGRVQHDSSELKHHDHLDISSF